MWAAFPPSDYYETSVPSHGPQPATDLPPVSVWRTKTRAAAGGSHVHCMTDRRGRRPALPRQHRHAYAADFQRGLLTGAVDRLRSRPPRGDPRWSRAAHRPISTRLEPALHLRSFNTGSSRAPSRLARGAQTIWQFWPVSPLSGLLPTLTGVPRIRLPSAPPDYYDSQAVESFHPHSVTQRLVAHYSLEVQQHRRTGTHNHCPLNTFDLGGDRGGRGPRVVRIQGVRWWLTRVSGSWRLAAPRTRSARPRSTPVERRSPRVT
jgi:hypothetical protein